MKKIIILLFLIITLILSGCHANTHTETTENHGDDPVSENTDKTSDTDKNNVIDNNDNNSDNTDGKNDNDNTDVINNDDKNSENTDGKNDNDNTDDKNENERIKYSGNSTEYENKSGYISYVSSGSNDGVSVPAEVSFWPGRSTFENPDAPKKGRIEFNGETYKLRYFRSWGFPSSPYEINEYHSVDDNFTFYYRADTDEMTHYYFSSWIENRERLRIDPITLDEARTIADSGSLADPDAIFEMVSALAGAITTASAHSANST